MAKVYSPNESYTGVSASVAFSKGVGETKDKHLIQWFKEHGYTVEEAEQNQQPNNAGEKSVDEMTVDELKAYAEGKDIDLTGLTKKDDILNKIKVGK
ncbi:MULTISPECIES: hypothetical protein [Clostridium]|uniref:hypothetical protein n=1 Tax=Clostridium TaxID=1485 RepID=UPI00069CD9A1|nr:MULTISPECIES: hypothetical protein [Clostridium]KOF56622.1 hypothetical protein AGR56_07770 [Clostridium sp. DMHC 10]MCD2348466.1 hypothetical protein [Clostridium guangxiense]